MNNKMAISTYLLIIASKQQTKQTRRTETESWILECFDGCHKGGGQGEMGDEVRGLRSTNRQLTEQSWGCKVQYRKQHRQRTYMHDPCI